MELFQGIIYTEYTFATTGCYFTTNYIPNYNTVINAKFTNSGSSSNYCGIFGNSEGNSNGLQLMTTTNKYEYVRGGTEIRINDTIRGDFEVELSSSAAVINGNSYFINGGQNYPENYLCINDLGGNGNYVSDGIYYKEIKIYENGILMSNILPCIDENNIPCFYDTISSKYIYNDGDGTPIAGPIVHTFNVDKNNFSFESTGGTDTFTVEAETGWTATTSSNMITLSQYTGNSGFTTVTVNCPQNTLEAKRDCTITLTDDEGYDIEIYVSQKKNGLIIYKDKFKVGETNVNKEYYGSTNANKVYIGSEEVYRKLSFAPKLSLSTDSLTFKATGETSGSVIVHSNSQWTYATDVDWLTITISGNSLNIEAEEYFDEEEPRYATVTVTASNGDITKTVEINVLQKKNSKFVVDDFMFNYNAKQYVQGTKTMPKADGQNFDEDLVLNDVGDVRTDCLYINGSNYMLKDFGSIGANPFNRDSQNSEFTFIYKCDNFGNSNLFSNREDIHGAYNYMVRGNSFHMSVDSLKLTPSSFPAIVYVRVNSNRIGERKCVTTGQYITDTALDWGNTSQCVGFFSGYGDHQHETFRGLFYWMFCATRELTDDEIQAVIDYNENL